MTNTYYKFSFPNRIELIVYRTHCVLNERCDNFLHNDEDLYFTPRHQNVQRVRTLQTFLICWSAEHIFVARQLNRRFGALIHWIGPFLGSTKPPSSQFLIKISKFEAAWKAGKLTKGENGLGPDGAVSWQSSVVCEVYSSPDFPSK